MLKDLGNHNNKDLLAANKITLGVVFETKNVEKILESVLFSKNK